MKISEGGKHIREWAIFSKNRGETPGFCGFLRENENMIMENQEPENEDVNSTASLLACRPYGSNVAMKNWEDFASDVGQ